MQILSEIATQPRMDDADFERIRKRVLSGLVASKNDPSAISRRVSNLVMYGAKHPYGEFSTEETVKHITLQKCKDFYSSYFRPNIGYLAIIGDITSEQAHALTSKYLGPWQRGEVPTATLPTPAQLSKNVVYVVDRPSAVQ
jgi:predicted Zn-dependent peptidase